MYQEYSIGNDYIIIMRQAIQTNDPQIINRIEIGTIIGETKAYLLLRTSATKRYVKKSLITKLIDISGIQLPAVQALIDKMDGGLI